MRAAAIQSASQACTLGSFRQRDSSICAPRRQLHVARVGGFDEGAAQVRRLLDRDRKEMDFDELDKSFASSDAATPASASEADAAGYTEASPSNSVARFAADKTPVSPFGPNALSAPIPFSSPSSSRKPFAEPAGMSPTMQPDAIDRSPWWTRVTLPQVVVVLTFTAMISLMVGTFFVVLNMGAIRINE